MELRLLSSSKSCYEISQYFIWVLLKFKCVRILSTWICFKSKYLRSVMSSDSFVRKKEFESIGLIISSDPGTLRFLSQQWLYAWCGQCPLLVLCIIRTYGYFLFSNCLCSNIVRYYKCCNSATVLQLQVDGGGQVTDRFQIKACCERLELRKISSCKQAQLF